MIAKAKICIDGAIKNVIAICVKTNGIVKKVYNACTYFINNGVQYVPLSFEWDNIHYIDSFQNDGFWEFSYNNGSFIPSTTGFKIKIPAKGYKKLFVVAESNNSWSDVEETELLAFASLKNSKKGEIVLADGHIQTYEIQIDEGYADSNELTIEFALTSVTVKKLAIVTHTARLRVYDVYGIKG